MASLKELGDLVNARVVGNSKLVIDGVSSLDDGKPSTISYLYSKKYEKFLDSTQAKHHLLDHGLDRHIKVK